MRRFFSRPIVLLPFRGPRRLSTTGTGPSGPKASLLGMKRSPLHRSKENEEWLCIRRDSLLKYDEVQPVDRLLVVDFEATCEVEGRSAADRSSDEQEIIEFPGTILDVTPAGRCAMVAEIQKYVQPVRNPLLSEFCTELTGITQDMVMEADTFPVVLEQFLAWMKSHGLDPEDPKPSRLKRKKGFLSFAVVAHGDWDFGTMLPKQLALLGDDAARATPRCFRSWIDVGNIIDDVFGEKSIPRRTGSGLDDTLRFLRRPLVGRAHCGLDDTRKIAEILRCLHSLGVKLDERVPSKPCFHCGERGHDHGACPMLQDWVCARCSSDVASHNKMCSTCGFEPTLQQRALKTGRGGRVHDTEILD